MRYAMRQKLFSWGDDFIIKDEDGRDVTGIGQSFTPNDPPAALARP